MENTGNDTDALPAGDLLPDPEFDEHGYDTNEELLLLQMMGTANDAVSPILQAVLDDRVDIGWPSGQRQQSPLLMERPQSSGIDNSAFSFAKPAQNRKPFSLQPASRLSSFGANQAKPDRARDIVGHNSGAEQGDQDQYVARSYSSIKLKGCRTAVCASTRNAEFPTSPHNIESSSVTTDKRQGTSEQLILSTLPSTDARSQSGASIDCQTDQVLPSEPAPEDNQQNQRSEHGIQGMYFSSLDSLDVNLVCRRGSVWVFWFECKFIVCLA